MKRKIPGLISSILIAASLPASAPGGEAQAGRWYRGNSHMHSTRSDGELAPSASSRWYHDNGYDYIVLTDHRVFLADNDISIPNRRSDFLVIQGEEFHSLTAYGDNHTSVLNASGALGDISAGSTTLSEFYNKVSSLVESRQGLPFINHPTWSSLVPASEFLKIKGIRHFELFNGSTDTDNFGMYGTGMPPIENLWDSVLTNGGKFYGVGSDDLHKFTPRPHHSNPMTGWTMIKAPRLAVADILEAYRKGDFYATSGVMLKDLSSTLGLYRVVIDREATLRELARRDSAKFTNPGRPVKTGTPGYRIEYFGPRGRLLKTVTEDSASFQVTKDLAYVRVRVTYLRNISAAGAPYENNLGRADYVAANNLTREEYHAWGQPYFTDARREGPALVFGCMDPAYFEYNPAANVAEAGACKNKSTSIHIPADREGPGADLIIRVSQDLGAYTIRIRSVDGKAIRVLPPVPDRMHQVENLARYGTYLIEIRGEKRTLAKRIRLH